MTRRHNRRPASTGTPLVEARGLTKRYGAILAVDGVDLGIGHGEIVAIVGDNGAGKSTLVEDALGRRHARRGRDRRGRAGRRRSAVPRTRGGGIETIYQDLALLPEPGRGHQHLPRPRARRRSGGGSARMLDRKAMREEAKRHLGDLKINIPKIRGTAVEAMSGGQRQSVAIARAMMWASKLVIMDEPTAALGVAQSAAVLELVQAVASAARRS